jgi:signal transduction histidine kinase
VLTLSDPGIELWRRFEEGRPDLSDHPVIPRWRRVHELRRAARARHALARRRESLDKRELLSASQLARGQELLRAAAEEFNRRGCVLLITDQEGVLLAAHGLDRIPDPGIREKFSEGARWDELEHGTNAVGTAIAEDRPVAVVGRAHSDPDAHGLACYAAPIHDVDGQIVAVIDVTGPVQLADPLLGVSIEGMAAALEGLLRARALEQLGDRLRTLERQHFEARAHQDALARTLEAHETFVAMVGHDLRNPLSVVLSGADMLGRGDDPRRQRAAERIRSSSRRMLGLIDQLSDLARARLAGGIPLSPGLVDLAAVTERVADECRALHHERTILVQRLGDCRGRWDTVRMEQIASNLIGNALRHGVRARPIHVLIDGRASDGVTLMVSNAGEIDAAVLPTIFEPFRSAHPQRTGLGLGLYIVQQIVHAHRGSVDVWSRDGKTTFRVDLPRSI